MSEADTCREYITPALQHVGWEKVPHYIRQEEYTSGRLIPVGDGDVAVRGERKRADYILYYQRDFKLAVLDVHSSDPTTVLGSYNWTGNAAHANDENLIIIHDPALAPPTYTYLLLILNHTP